jgi:hypothetical protein
MGNSNISLSTALTEVRNILDEPNPQFWSNSMLTSWLNQGAADMQRQVEELRAESNPTVTAAVQDYPAPDDTLRIYKIEYVPEQGGNNYLSYPLEFRGRIGMDQIWGNLQSQPAAFPSYWTTWFSPLGAAASPGGGTQLTIRLYPSPYQNGTLNIFYYRLTVPVVANSDTLDIVPGWEDTLYDYAVYRALQRDADPRWKDFQAIYLAKVEVLRARVQPDWTDQPSYFATGPQGIPRWLLGAEF